MGLAGGGAGRSALKSGWALKDLDDERSNQESSIILSASPHTSTLTWTHSPQIHDYAFLLFLQSFRHDVRPHGSEYEAAQPMAETKLALNDDAITIQYRYDPLPERTIRLLKIPEKSIEQPWSLKVYNLEHCPSYICLSYTWGAPLNTEECEAEYEGVKRSLYVQSGNHTGRLEIGLNLWEGLEQLIAAGHTDYLWVDAICINQDDPQERSSQVAIMGQIYGESEEVVVWLGKDQSNLEDFAWSQDTLLPALEEHFDAGGGFSDLMKVIEKANMGADPATRWRGYVLFNEQHR
jgi:Heterokaryon incompatibility protein (HET)